jgi:hypothetical protein
MSDAQSAHITNHVTDVSTSDRLKYAQACLALGLIDAALFHLRLIPKRDLTLPEVHVIRLELQHARAARRR